MIKLPQDPQERIKFDHMTHKRIAIIGISASGKSTVAKAIAKNTGLPLFRMDQLFWDSNLKEIPEEEYLKEHRVLIEKGEWVIEGYIDEKMSERLSRADLVLYLDYSGIRCVWQLIQRWIRNRSEFHNEPPETVDLGFMWRVLMRKERDGIEKAIAKTKPINLKRFSKPSDFLIE